MCLCLAIGAVAFNGESVNLVEAREDFSCDEKGYLEYGVPSQKLGHLGQSLLAGICEICGLPVVID